jgi:hypothetical protein
MSQVTFWPFEDPDADHREDYDGPPIQLRANRRMQARYFQQNSAAAADPVDGGPAVEDGAEARDPDLGHEDEAGVFDGVAAEVTPEHNLLILKLVKQFQIRYDRGEVKWLKFPNRKLWKMCFPDAPYEPDNP